MKTLTTYLGLALFLSGLLMMSGCSETNSPTVPELTGAAGYSIQDSAKAKKPKEIDIKFKGEGAFDSIIDEDGLLVFLPVGEFDLLNVSHFGLSQVFSAIRVDPVTFAFVDGWFSIIGANGRDGLTGHFSDFQLHAAIGEYDLDWAFTGGTGRFENAEGTGHTDGLVDLATGHAKFEFHGTITY